ncbi:hypothetical protein [Photobacterium sp. OFAV2-7]|uniref:hypothetical protein n=1 Tax=Photobacterium sp. OFAV2-7 TaxID=2917748 RepID=UPI001EF51C83|nr:hypothetical protein [Photobacterium sp. OFAV2-7]MCG7584428.1 hypothetical protein [Photobacterium sp. OFAV2-7]
MALPSLDTEQQIKIQALIKGWRSKLTWDLLVERIKEHLEITTTRQTLSQYIAIKDAYIIKKQELRGKPIQAPKLLKYLQKDIALAEQTQQLENEIELYKKEVAALKFFIKELNAVAQSNPAVMDVFTQTMKKIKG